jgi:hypothetical protein
MMTETSMLTSPMPQTLTKLTAEVAELGFSGKPFADVMADDRFQPPHRIARRGPEQETGNAAKRWHLTQIEAELRHRMDPLHARPRDALAVPPSTEIFGTQPASRHVMLDPHAGHVRAARVPVASACEEFGDLLSEKNLIAVSTERGVEGAHVLDERAPDREVRPERHLLPLFEDERLRAVIEDGERAPEEVIRLPTIAAGVAHKRRGSSTIHPANRSRRLFGK